MDHKPCSYAVAASDLLIKGRKDSRNCKVGFKINFNREFFHYQPPRPLFEIVAELAAVEKRIMGLLREATE